MTYMTEFPKDPQADAADQQKRSDTVQPTDSRPQRPKTITTDAVRNWISAEQLGRSLLNWVF